ncbi:hypothetical protein GCM10022255_115630 [Dactylosporangium darangshiense]|uniref:Response regulatory domain-containing protein n=1 Tax=Dactylosporangium darangshiense TaxID=579108 RepID=A0ABP8DWB1_9ACTN
MLWKAADMTVPALPVYVLLVEDDPGNVALISDAFAGHRLSSTLHIAANGIEALEFLRLGAAHADAARPDLIMRDLNMPRTGASSPIACPLPRYRPKGSPPPVGVFLGEDGDVDPGGDIPSRRLPCAVAGHSVPKWSSGSVAACAC